MSLFLDYSYETKFCLITSKLLLFPPTLLSRKFCLFKTAYLCEVKEVGVQIRINWLSSVQLLSCVWLFSTPWTAAPQASLSITNSGVYPNSCLLNRWCHPTISSSVIPFSSRFQSFPASRSFPVSQLFASGGQSIGVLASTSVLPINTRTDIL